MAASIIDCKIIQAKLRKNFRSILSILKHGLKDISNNDILQRNSSNRSSIKYFFLIHPNKLIDVVTSIEWGCSDEEQGTHVCQLSVRFDV